MLEEVDREKDELVGNQIETGPVDVELRLQTAAGARVLAGAPRRQDQECGLCVRIWDPQLQLWRFTFHGTSRGAMVQMFGRMVGDELVQEQAEGADLVRWVFSQIRPDSFYWRNERSRDGGQTWRLEQDARALRAEASVTHV